MTTLVVRFWRDLLEQDLLGQAATTKKKARSFLTQPEFVTYTGRVGCFRYDCCTWLDQCEGLVRTRRMGQCHPIRYYAQ